MKVLHKLIELDMYFKKYELFKKYLDNVHSQYVSLLDVRNKIEELLPTLKDNEVNISKKFNQAVKEIEEDNYDLNKEFEDYDFSKDKVIENINDYKILIYEFVKNNYIKYLSKHLNEDGFFADMTELSNYLKSVERLLWEFFNENFVFSEDALVIFEKAKQDLLSKEDYIKSYLLNDET